MSFWLLILVVPVILFPAMLVWYINVSGIYSVIKDKIRKRSRLPSHSSLSEAGRFLK